MMAATFFGEVVRAPCRAGTEDEEEDGEASRETPEDREVRRQLARKRWDTWPRSQTPPPAAGAAARRRRRFVPGSPRRVRGERSGAAARRRHLPRAAGRVREGNRLRACLQHGFRSFPAPLKLLPGRQPCTCVSQVCVMSLVCGHDTALRPTLKLALRVSGRWIMSFKSTNTVVGEDNKAKILHLFNLPSPLSPSLISFVEFSRNFV